MIGRFMGKVARRLENRFSVSVDESCYYPQQSSCQIPTLWLLFERFLGKRPSGTFVEVGAYDGVFVSNTWGLASRGWTGWMVEPVPEFAKACARNHAAHKNVRIAQQAIGSRDDEEISLLIGGTLTTASPNSRDEYLSTEWAKKSLTMDSILVKSTSLDHFLSAQSVPVNFDVLVIDVEGFESEVFAGFSVSQWKPKMMIIELNDTHPDLQASACADSRIYESILRNGYVVIYKDHINTVFVDQELYASASAIR